jgi:hypothetical protein
MSQEPITFSEYLTGLTNFSVLWSMSGAIRKAGQHKIADEYAWSAVKSLKETESRDGVAMLGAVLTYYLGRCDQHEFVSRLKDVCRRLIVEKGFQPEAVDEMPVFDFARLAKNLLASGGDATEPVVHSRKRESMGAIEADTVARDLATREPSFVGGTKFDWAEAISRKTGRPCSPTTVVDSEFWKEEMKRQGRRKTKGATPRAVTLHAESVVGTPGDLLDELSASEEMQWRDRAIQAVNLSALSEAEKRAAIDSLNSGEMSIKQVFDLVGMYPRKVPGKPFRTV